jgi:hypothetical protein
MWHATAGRIADLSNSISPALVSTWRCLLRLLWVDGPCIGSVYQPSLQQLLLWVDEPCMRSVYQPILQQLQGLNCC